VSCKNGSCAWSCSYPNVIHSNVCVNVYDDINNCGSIGNVCVTSSAAVSCTQGYCTYECDEGTSIHYLFFVLFHTNTNQTWCMSLIISGQTLSDRSCYNLNDDIRNCGAVGNRCAFVMNGTSLCSSGTCGVRCDDGYVLVNSICVSNRPDTNRCGQNQLMCTSPPNGIPLCLDGSCTYGCMSGYTFVNRGCFDTTSDANNCGINGTQCNAPDKGTAVCVDSRCSFTCERGYIKDKNICISSNVPSTSAIITTYDRTTNVITTTPTPTTTSHPYSNISPTDHIFFLALNVIGILASMALCMSITANRLYGR
jgi:hypothetical protein